MFDHNARELGSGNYQKLDAIRQYRWYSSTSLA